MFKLIIKKKTWICDIAEFFNLYYIEEDNRTLVVCLIGWVEEQFFDFYEDYLELLNMNEEGNAEHNANE